MTRKRISGNAERTLDDWLDQLVKGQTLIQDLPLAVSAWLHVGELYGRASRQPEINQLNHQLDVLYGHAFLTKDARRERILQRLEHGLAQADEATWQCIEQELAQMMGQRQRTLLGAENNRAVEGGRFDSKPENRRRNAA